MPARLGRERPNYLRAMERAERRWGVPVHVQMATFHQESRLVGDARPPFRYALDVIPMGRMSSAFGYSQALDGTWDEYIADTGNRRAQRTDIADAADFMGWYMTLTRERNGIPLTDARNQYLAYHEGRRRLMRGAATMQNLGSSPSPTVSPRGPKPTGCNCNPAAEDQRSRNWIS